MTQEYDDQKLFDLFHKNLPPVQMPPELAAKMRRSVMAEVAETAEVAPHADEFAYLAASLQEREPVQRTVRTTAEPSGFWQRLNRAARSLRWAPPVALAGATVAVALFFFYLVPSLYPPEGASDTPSTGSGESSPVVLAPVTTTVQSALATVENGNATLLRGASGDIQDLGPGSQVELWPGDELITLTGNARLDYFENQASYIDPGARIQLLELDEQDNGTQVTVKVNIGVTRHEVDVPLGASDRFEVRTPSSLATAVGTNFVVSSVSQSESYYAVNAGVITVTMGEEQTAVIAGEELFAIQNQPLVTANIIYDPTETPAALALAEDTVEPTETEVPPTPTSEEAVEPTAMSTSVPTYTPEPTDTVTPVPTDTPEPTDTVTPVPTDTPEPTATSTLHPTETPTVTPIPMVVKLKWPNDRVGGGGDSIFRWEANVLPPEGQAFELIFWKEGQDPFKDGFGLALPTRNTSVTVNLNTLDDRLGGLLDPGEYRWGVRLVTTDPYERLKMFNESRLFRFQDRTVSGSPLVPGD